MLTDYSQKEIEMFTALGKKRLIESDDSSLTPINVYKITVEDVFMSGVQGLHVDNLRRTFSAIKKCNPYRMTEEFDNLICEM